MTQLSNGAAKTFATRSGHRHPSSIVAPLSPSFKKNVAHLQTWEKAFRHHKEGKINLLPRVDLPLHTPLLRHCNPVNAPHLGRQTQAANNSHVQRQMWIRTRGVARVMPDIRCQTYGASYLMSDTWCQTSYVRHLVPEILCQTSGARHLVPNIWCQTRDDALTQIGPFEMWARKKSQNVWTWKSQDKQIETAIGAIRSALSVSVWRPLNFWKIAALIPNKQTQTTVSRQTQRWSL